MLIFNLNKFARARVWFESNNEIFNKDFNDNLYEFKSDESKIFEDKTTILELYIPAGGRVYYGILGLFYKYTSNKNISANIYTSQNNNQLFNNSLLLSEPVYIGLAKEYKEFVWQGLNQAYKKDRLCLTGNLNFCYAAHGLASSCGWIFQILSYCLVNLMIMPEKKINNEMLIDLIKEAKLTL